jgi:DNA-binding CsgD family transcriptional regulator
VSSETLISAIQAATRGESFLQSAVTGRVVAAFARLMESGGPKAEALVLPLSAREGDILTLLGTGASNKEIADRLCLAEGTVKNHVTNILTKPSAPVNWNRVNTICVYERLRDRLRLRGAERLANCPTLIAPPDLRLCKPMTPTIAALVTADVLSAAASTPATALSCFSPGAPTA